MESKAKILWVHDNFDGPINGLCEYKGEKLWFARTQQPFINQKPLVSVNDDVKFNLYRLDDSTLKLVEDNHSAHCLEMNLPLHYGDPMISVEKDTVTRPDFKQMIPEGEQSVEVDTSIRAIATVKKYIHQYDPNTIEGDFVTMIDATDFSNFRIPHRVIRK